MLYSMLYSYYTIVLYTILGQILVFKPDFQPFGPRPGRGQYYLPNSRQQPEARGT